MNDEPPSTPSTSNSPNWLQTLMGRFRKTPVDSTEHLLSELRDAGEREVIDPQTLATIERVFQVRELRVRDVMVPRSQMTTIDRDAAVEDFLPTIIETAHSRFPVTDGDKDKIVGILLAKDLLTIIGGATSDFSVRDHLRPVNFIPESKRLNTLLHDFQENRNHMAIVVDEYGGISGLVTIEDVIEQIVGEIDDEHDVDDDETLFRPRDDGSWTIKARCPIEDFNEHFNSRLTDDEFDTIGGLVIHTLGRVPARGEKAIIGDRFEFEILNADGRRVHLLAMREVEPRTEQEAEADQSE